MFVKKSILIIFTLLILFLSVFAVSSATFNNTSTTEVIQNFINTNVSDTELVLDGEFNNSSTLDITRSLKISGKNNAVITKNSSSTASILFNITVINVTIENLIIRNYGTAIQSTKGNLTINNTDIKTENIAIKIQTTTNEDIKDVFITNNKITTTNNNAHGVYLHSDSGGVVNNNSLINNTISATGNNANGVYLHSYSGDVNNNSLTNNTISTGNGAPGVYLHSPSGGVVNNNSFTNNTISTTGNEAHGVYLHSFPSGVVNNNSLINNTISTGNYCYGVYLFARSGVVNNSLIGNDIVANHTGIYVVAPNIRDLNVSYNCILANESFINLNISDNSNVFFANWLGNNTPDMNKITKITMISYYTINARVLKNTGLVGEDWIIDYTFYLNGTNSAGDFWKLPVFKAKLLNSSDSQISARIAYNTGNWNIHIEHPSIEDFTVVLDNEKINLGTFTSEKGATNLNAEIVGTPSINTTVKINGVLKNVQGNPLAGKLVSLIVNGQLIESKNTDSNGECYLTTPLMVQVIIVSK